MSGPFGGFQVLDGDGLALTGADGGAADAGVEPGADAGGAVGVVEITDGAAGAGGDAGLAAVQAEANSATSGTMRARESPTAVESMADIFAYRTLPDPV